MSDPEPLRIGDKITVQHISGLRRTVIFDGFYGKNLNRGCVNWGEMAGKYQVILSTGQLTPKKASLWRVIDSDLKRLEITRKFELAEASMRIKERRYGDRR